MKRLLSACLLTLASSVAVVGEPPVPKPAEPATVETEARADKAEHVILRAEDARRPRVVHDTGCVRSTGTLIRRPLDRNGCNGQPGSSYSRAELDRTGAASTGEALKRLDSRL